MAWRHRDSAELANFELDRASGQAYDSCACLVLPIEKVSLLTDSETQDTAQIMRLLTREHEQSRHDLIHRQSRRSLALIG